MERKLITSGSEFEEQIAYSRAVIIGQMIFVSGTTGYDYNTMKISDNVIDQADQAIRNIESALVDAGSCLQDVVKVTYILPEAGEFEKCWPVLRKYFGFIRPAATMISANLLDTNMKIEIEVTALKSQ
ncbi:uncharacterized protein AC631_03491 [Debaryomyces fabryi]|uniref:Uncharacterized protein n=1 Tax=Debaryomyces fabryi TaxID=58627 RepID=A0A0V1PXH9_9ASCO|nr:uncharacterized protein AC631_03491 [Debaryomyces fabryi]KSA00780.1 hypothetical protein AC631_03491 [Debaryomyces fabryi]CUM45203.1 unnamed protein product [Debaryomyces fabryi]